MQTLTFRVPDANVPRLLQLVESIPTIEHIEARAEVPVINQTDADEDRPPTKEEILNDIRQGIVDIRRAEKTGEKIGRDACDVLEELRRELA